jgi:hypothetical protein
MTMPFGKYKGRVLTAIPSNYLAWLLDACDDLSPTLRTYVRRELDRRLGYDDEGNFDSAVPAVASLADRWYRRLSLEFHPDRGGSHEAMKAVNRARDLLLAMAGAA